MLVWSEIGGFNPWAAVMAAMMGLAYWYAENPGVSNCFDYGNCPIS